MTELWFGPNQVVDEKYQYFEINKGPYLNKDKIVVNSWSFLYVLISFPSFPSS